MRLHRTIVPPIKCQGIKTKLVPWIKAVVPLDFDGTWIEPFMGSGVVAFNVLPKRALLADSNPHLIHFYQGIASDRITPALTRLYLEAEGAELLRSGGEHYYTVRERFNRLHDPMDFLFLNRACFNGLIRFNSRGEFNVPFCRKPNRFAQPYVTKICNQVQAVSDVVIAMDFTFLCQDLADTIGMAQDADLIYCDPPYIGRHTDYFNRWDEGSEVEMSRLLSSVRSRFILSTWHSNRYRKNTFIDDLWSDYYILTREHFYHIGAKEDNRNPMLEALVMNYDAALDDTPNAQEMTQGRLLEQRARYPARRM